MIIYEVRQSSGWEVHSTESKVATFREQADADKVVKHLGELARVVPVIVEESADEWFTRTYGETRKCEYTMSHTRHWCGNPRCRNS